MYTLKQTWYHNFNEKPTRNWDGKMLCMAMNAEIVFKTNETEGYSLHYSFTVVTHGWLNIVYNGQEITLKPNDLYIYSPGLPITILSSSSDYDSVCIMIDEQSALEIPTVRYLVSIAYKPQALLGRPLISLSPELAGKLADRIREMIVYFKNPHVYKSQVLQHLFSVFILDVQNILDLANTQQQPPQRMEELFISFLQLLPEHFVEHHDISFYAEQLNISTTYLSRIVKQLTNRTVVDYINQLLAMEASFLLGTTSLTVSQIADRLHFSDIASFSKFFLRMKGLSPKNYRKRSS